MEAEELVRLGPPVGDRSNVQMTFGGLLQNPSFWFAVSFSTVQRLCLQDALAER